MAKKDEKTVQTQEQAQAAETTAPAPAAKKGDNPVDIFRDALMKTKRDGGLSGLCSVNRFSGCALQRR